MTIHKHNSNVSTMMAVHQNIEFMKQFWWINHAYIAICLKLLLPYYRQFYYIIIILLLKLLIQTQWELCGAKNTLMDNIIYHLLETKQNYYIYIYRNMYIINRLYNYNIHISMVFIFLESVLYICVSYFILLFIVKKFNFVHFTIFFLRIKCL